MFTNSRFTFFSHAAVEIALGLSLSLLFVSKFVSVTKRVVWCSWIHSIVEELILGFCERVATQYASTRRLNSPGNVIFVTTSNSSSLLFVAAYRTVLHPINFSFLYRWSRWLMVKPLGYARCEEQTLWASSSHLIHRLSRWPQHTKRLCTIHWWEEPAAFRLWIPLARQARWWLCEGRRIWAVRGWSTWGTTYNRMDSPHPPWGNSVQDKPCQRDWCVERRMPPLEAQRIWSHPCFRGVMSEIHSSS